MDWFTSITQIPFVGSFYANRLSKLDIHTIGDLLCFIPFRYDDFSKITQINRVANDSVVTIKAKVIKSQTVFPRSKKSLQKITLGMIPVKLE